MQGPALLAVSFVAVYVLQKLLAFWKGIRSFGGLPGPRTLLGADGLLGNLLPRMKYITVGSNHTFDHKHTIYQEYGWDAVSYWNLYPSPRGILFIADAQAIKEISLSRARFPKPVEVYKVLTFYGRNIVASEGDEWKTYRKISAPSFSDRNNKLVWDSTMQIMDGLFNDVWGDKESITVDHCVDLTLPIALFVIGAAGFGRSVSWKEDTHIGPGHEMSFKESLHIVTTDFMWKLAVPNWALGLHPKLRRVRQGYIELRTYMQEMIHDRQKNDKFERHDLFSNFLAANNGELDITLTDDQVIGNIFIFLVAGHETTAHTLSFTFGLLALYQDEQEKLYQNIKTVLADGHTPTYEEMPLFTQSMAVFYETLRLFPPVTAIPKYSAEDTTLTVSNMNGEKLTIPVPKGTSINISAPGVHYNPRYWQDPYAFKPDRFLKDWPRDAFIPFSSGARACIGRKFFETEGIAILTLLVSKYKITVKEEPQFENETFEERKERVLKGKAGLTVTPVRMPLVFTRRN